MVRTDNDTHGGYGWLSWWSLVRTTRWSTFANVDTNIDNKGEGGDCGSNEGLMMVMMDLKDILARLSLRGGA